MPRIRSLKPDFFKDEDLGTLPRDVRMLYAGLWTQADRDGRMEYRPGRIRAELFPFDDDIDAVQVDRMCRMLSDPQIFNRPQKRFVEIYTVDGEHYLQIFTLGKHQKFHKDERPKNFPASMVPAGCQQGADRVPQNDSAKPLIDIESRPAGCQQGASRPVYGVLCTETVNGNGVDAPVLVELTYHRLIEIYPQTGQQIGVADGTVLEMLTDDIPQCDHGPLLKAAKNYADKVRAEQTEARFVRQLPNFLRDNYWRNFLTITPSGAEQQPRVENEYERECREIAQAREQRDNAPACEAPARPKGL